MKGSNHITEFGMKLRHFVKTVDNDRGVDHRMTFTGVPAVELESVLRRVEVTER